MLFIHCIEQPESPPYILYRHLWMDYFWLIQTSKFGFSLNLKDIYLWEMAESSANTAGTLDPIDPVLKFIVLLISKSLISVYMIPYPSHFILIC